MSLKQDRQFVRTPAALEQKYNLGKFRAETQTTANKQTNQMTQMNQSFSQYTTATNATLAELAEKNAELERKNAELAAKVDKLSASNISAVMVEVGGEQIVLADAGGTGLNGLVLYGRTTPEMVNTGVGGSVTVRVGISETDANPQTMTVATPGGLPGVPVSVGGDYTDAEGQRWAADYKDFARGVSVRRIGVIESYAGEEIPGVFLSSTGDLSTGARVLYVLPEAVETALPDGELSAFAALHTYNPGTVISNDAGAWMKVRYAADIKAYIDNQIERIV